MGYKINIGSTIAYSSLVVYTVGTDALVEAARLNGEAAVRNGATRMKDTAPVAVIASLLLKNLGIGAPVTQTKGRKFQIGG
jgi:hypothetical protein